MWVITVFSNGECTKMFEFDTKKEAQEALRKIHGYTILTQMVDLNERRSPLVAAV